MVEGHLGEEARGEKRRSSVRNTPQKFSREDWIGYASVRGIECCSDIVLVIELQNLDGDRCGKAVGGPPRRNVTEPHRISVHKQLMRPSRSTYLQTHAYFNASAVVPRCDQRQHVLRPAS